MSFFKSKKSKYKFTNSILEKLEKNSEVQVSLANLVIDDYFKFAVKEVEKENEVEKQLIISEDGFKLIDEETQKEDHYFGLSTCKEWHVDSINPNREYIGIVFADKNGKKQIILHTKKVPEIVACIRNIINRVSSQKTTTNDAFI